MKKTFSGYYHPTETEFSDIWKNCLFVFDANVLLNLYRYSNQARESLLSLFSQLYKRIWIPHQAGLEYHRNRPTVIKQQIDAYAQVKKILQHSCEKLSNELRVYLKHQYIDISSIIGSFKDMCDKFDQNLTKLHKNHPDFLSRDPILEKITSLFSGKIGSPYSNSKLNEIYKEGKSRYENKVPPGFLDVNKDGPAKYGDLIFWFQIIDQAKQIKKPIILVTDDRKGDWWLRLEEKTIGPQPVLVQEIFDEAKNPFYMYSSDQFMHFATKYLKKRIEPNAIKEISAIRKRDEKTSSLLDYLAEYRRIAHPSAEISSLDTYSGPVGPALEAYSRKGVLKNYEKYRASAIGNALSSRATFDYVISQQGIPVMYYNPELNSYHSIEGHIPFDDPLRTAMLQELAKHADFSQVHHADVSTEPPKDDKIKESSPTDIPKSDSKGQKDSE